MAEALGLQDKVASSVAGVIEPALQAVEIRRSSERSIHDITAYDLYLRALPHCFSFEKKRITLALDLLGQAIKRDPHYGPGALFFKRRFDEAAAKLLESLERAPNFAVTYRFLASCYAHMGRLDEAREIVRRLRAITPVVIESATRYRNPEHRELFLSGLRMAAAEAGSLPPLFDALEGVPCGRPETG